MKMRIWDSRESATKLLVFPPILVGLVFFGWMVWRGEPPARRDLLEVSRGLRVMSVAEIDAVPIVIGHGTVEPEQVWRAIAEVKGRVIMVHDRLASGGLISAGEELLRIDPIEYQLAVAQLEADIEQANSQLAELQAQTESYSASLAIEQASLALIEKELGRLRTLNRTNAASDSEVDAKEREYLAQRQSVQNLQNSMSLIPSQRKSLQATVAVKETNLQQAKLDLEKTKVVAPFDCRLGDLSIVIGQFLGAGEVLFEALSTTAVELDAQVAPHDAQRLVDSENAALMPGSLSPEQIREMMDLGVTVRLRSGNAVAEWDGRVERLREQFDTQTRTLGIVVTVDKPYEKIIPGQRPALVRGMYCEVEFRAPERKRRIVIPHSALTQGHVYILDQENRLRRQEVEVEFSQTGFVCLRSGLQSGDLLVVSDATPAIEGMLVEPVEDADLLGRLTREASARRSP